MDSQGDRRGICANCGKRKARLIVVVRLKDIARELDLSAVTVSKALRNHPDIATTTRTRVLRRAEELNYQPNFTARSLVSGRTWTMGLVVPDLLHPFFAIIAKAIAGGIRGQGYSLLICSSDEDPELELQEIRRLLARRVDVILLASCQSSVEELRQTGIQNARCILIDRRVPGLDADFVGSHDEQIGELATSHLLEQGCRLIAHIRGPEVSTALGRLEGYRRALAMRGLRPLPEHIVSLGNSADLLGVERGHAAALKLLRSTPRPDGIVCYNSPSTQGAMHAILGEGMRLPDDIALIGCGNMPNSEFFRVPLSSIDQGSEAIGSSAAALALKLAGRRPAVRQPEVKLLPARLMVRESSVRLPRVSSARHSRGGTLHQGSSACSRSSTGPAKSPLDA